MSHDVDLVLETAQADYFWAPDDVKIVDRPELAYAVSERDTLFFNSVVRARPDMVPAGDLVAEVDPHYQGKASRWSLNKFSDTPEMRRALENVGYSLSGEFHGYAMDPMSYSRALRHGVTVERVSTLEQLREVDEVLSQVFEREPSANSDLQRELADCSSEGARVGRFLSRVDGVPAGVGGLTLFPALRCAFIWGGGVLEQFRGRGAYTAVLAARTRFASTRGIDILGVYGNAKTSGPILSAHGFERFGRMNQWSRG